MDITYHRGAHYDAQDVFHILTQSLSDLSRRTGTPEAHNSWADPAFVAMFWGRFEPLFAYLSASAEQYWIAEQDDHIIGYARSTLAV